MGPRGGRQNNIKNDLNDIDYDVWIGFIWLGLWTSSELF